MCEYILYFLIPLTTQAEYDSSDAEELAPIQG